MCYTLRYICRACYNVVVAQKHKTFTFRLSRDEKRAIVKAAKASRVSVAEYVRGAVTARVEGNGRCGSDAQQGDDGARIPSQGAQGGGSRKEPASS